jgi:beta-glucosidase
MTDTDTVTAPYQDTALPLEARAADLLTRLTLAEKVQLMAGETGFALAPIARLGVPSLRMTDGPTGVRSNVGATATVFPVGVAMAATWNVDLTGHVAAAIAREAQALGEHIVLAPTINMVRTPVWGRNFESYSEDPFLAGRIGAAYVAGLQGQGVGASLKHYAANNQELNRMGTSAQVDERTLREIYTAAFEHVVGAANPWTVMASYNKVNGVHASENPHLLTQMLKDEWGYDGVVVSDWGAVHSTAPAANAGLDLEMPGAPRHFGDKLLAAVAAGEVSQAVIDGAALRMARLLIRVGLLDGGPAPVGELRSARHQTVARCAAEEAIVLLKNDGLLPLAPGGVKTLALIGPNSGAMRIQGDGSSRVTPGRRVTPLEALSALLGEGVRILHEDGGDNEPFPPAAVPAMFSPTLERAEPGLAAEYFADAGFDGPPIRTTVERRLLKWVSLFAPLRQPFAALRWHGFFWPEKSGTHEFSVRGDGDLTLSVNGAVLIDPSNLGADDAHDPTGSPALRRTAQVDLVAGRAYPIEIEYLWAKARPGAGFETITLGLRQPTGSIDQAVAAARGADAAIVIVGSASSTEAEGYDRDDIGLPGDQNELVEAVLAANPNTVVVVNAGAPMTMPWIARVRAVLLAWLPGEEGPAALADIVFGRASPSGRLPVSFPARLEDNPAQASYTAADVAPYAEGLFMGYRHYDRPGAPEPLFAFGHGLTFSSFDYADLEVPATAAAGQPVEVRLTLANTGAHPAKETVQLYIRPHAPALPRPVKELKGFAKLDLAPGERRAVSFTLTPRDFAYYDPQKPGWATDPGRYDILIAASAADVRLTGTVELTR